MKNITVCLIQPSVSHDNEENYQNMENLIGEAADLHPDIICLPERWYHLDFTGNFHDLYQKERGIQYQWVKNWATKFGIPIISGGIWEKSSEFEKPVIVSYYFDHLGQERFFQHKIHLYGIEKELLQPGQELKVFTDTRLNITFSILICFDLHISSMLTSKAVDNGAELIFSPTLIRDDGMDNWSIYLQARALEHRVPIISCNSIYSIFNRNFSGRSKIIHFEEGSASPVKLLVSEAPDYQTLLVGQINLDFPNSIREERGVQKYDYDQISLIIL